MNRVFASAVREVLIQACQGYGGILSEATPKVFSRVPVTAPGISGLLGGSPSRLRQYESSRELISKSRAGPREHRSRFPFPQRDCIYGPAVCS